MTTMLGPPVPLIPCIPRNCSQHHAYNNQHQQQDDDTANLLHFIDMASSNIKLALDRPSKSKRKVNHRKYLQKQLKRCGSSPKRGDAAASSVDGHGGGASKCSSRKETSQIGLQIKSLQALFDPRTLHKKCCSDSGPTAGAAPVGNSAKPATNQKAPLRNRKLPASFFVEPAVCQQQKQREYYPGQTAHMRSDQDSTLSASGLIGQSNVDRTLTVSSTGSVESETGGGLHMQNLAHHFHGNGNVSADQVVLGVAGYPALPADTLESILGQTELSELLAGQWHQRDSNHTPCEGSAGTCSPRSLSDSSDVYCASSPRPSSSSTQGRSPSWSPSFPMVPSGVQFGSHSGCGIEGGVSAQPHDVNAQFFVSSSPSQGQLPMDRQQQQQRLTYPPHQQQVSSPLSPLSPDPYRAEFTHPTSLYYPDQPHPHQLQTPAQQQLQQPQPHHQQQQPPHHHHQQQQQRQNTAINLNELPTFPQAFSPSSTAQCFRNGDIQPWGNLHTDVACYSYMC